MVAVKAPVPTVLVVTAVTLRAVVAAVSVVVEVVTAVILRVVVTVSEVTRVQ